MGLRRSPRGQHRLRTTDHRVLTIAQPSGTGVVGFTRYLDPPPTVRPETTSDGDSTVEVDQTATLLDMQLNERGDPSERLWIRAQLLGVPTDLDELADSEILSPEGTRRV